MSSIREIPFQNLDRYIVSYYNEHKANSKNLVDPTERKHILKHFLKLSALLLALFFAVYAITACEESKPPAETTAPASETDTSVPESTTPESDATADHILSVH